MGQGVYTLQRTGETKEQACRVEGDSQLAVTTIGSTKSIQKRFGLNGPEMDHLEAYTDTVLCWRLAFALAGAALRRQNAEH